MLGFTRVVFIPPPFMSDEARSRFPQGFLSFSPVWKEVNALKGKGGSFPARCRQRAEGGPGHDSTHREETILGLLSPQMVSSETVTLLCTAGPGYGSLAERSLVKMLDPSLSCRRGW